VDDDIARGRRGAIRPISAATEYRFKRGCALLARVLPGPAGKSVLEARIEIRQGVPSLNADPNMS
jgi:hypothetical protein